MRQIGDKPSLSTENQFTRGTDRRRPALSLGSLLARGIRKSVCSPDKALYLMDLDVGEPILSLIHIGYASHCGIAVAKVDIGNRLQRNFDI